MQQDSPAAASMQNLQPSPHQQQQFTTLGATGLLYAAEPLVARAVDMARINVPLLGIHLFRDQKARVRYRGQDVHMNCISVIANMKVHLWRSTEGAVVVHITIIRVFAMLDNRRGGRGYLSNCIT